MVCIFFGHRKCCGLEPQVLKSAIEKLIAVGVDTFYVGNHGEFDSLVFKVLSELERDCPEISVSVVLAYLPSGNGTYDRYKGRSIYPEGIEVGPMKFAIERRNKWMIEAASGGYCICCVNNRLGGAYRFAERAKKEGVAVLNLGSVEI